MAMASSRRDNKEKGKEKGVVGKGPFLSNGDRIRLESAVEGSHVSSKKRLWATDVAERTGVIVKVDHQIGDENFYAIALDRPLNNEPTRNETIFWKKFVAAEGLVTPQHHFLLVQASAMGESLQVSKLDVEATVGDELRRCAHTDCQKAQLLCKLIVTCQDPAHTMYVLRSTSCPPPPPPPLFPSFY